MIRGKFTLKSKFKPRGDQPKAISALTANFLANKKFQTLWGVTGSGKTFTIANVIERLQKPTLIIAHNKTLAAQLAEELAEYFPDNAVHYFVSYYDYYQPEAYLPTTDTYIEKDSAINEEIDRLRHAATHALLTRRDVIIVASVSCIYGLGSPEYYKSENIALHLGNTIARGELLKKFFALHFERNDLELKRGVFQVKGDSFLFFPAYADNFIRIEFFGDTVEKIFELSWPEGEIIGRYDSFEVFPAKHFITPDFVMKDAISGIKKELEVHLSQLRQQDKILEAQRLEQRTNYDLEMLEQTGLCAGIENYSRWFDKRKPGQPPTTLLDYFPADFLTVIDESHITLPQIGAMYAGDRSRKEKLVDFGFRLPSAFDNRPLKFEEFKRKIAKSIFVSATPREYEIKKSGKAIVKQFIRPTGLLDPEVEVRKSAAQIKNLVEEIEKRLKKSQRTLVITLTKRMAEELTEYLLENNIKVAYIHSDIQTLERSQILRSLRLGKYDCLVGINLLREGLDLPEVSLVAILDADKEGFLRSHTSLIQTIGRAARHAEGKVIMFADFTTDSMQKAIDETYERRKLQMQFNQNNGIVPQTIIKTLRPTEIKTEESLIGINRSFKKLPGAEKRRIIAELTLLMTQAAKKLEFEHAADLRDQITALESL